MEGRFGEKRSLCKTDPLPTVTVELVLHRVYMQVKNQISVSLSLRFNFGGGGGGGGGGGESGLGLTLDY